MSEHYGKSAPSPRATVQNLGQMAHRFVTLLELQGELLKADVKESRTAASRPLVTLLGGVMVGAGSVPVLLLAVAQGLREGADCSWTVSYLVAALLGVTIAVGATTVGWASLRKKLAVFHRSSEEFRKNVRWLKEALGPGSCEDRKYEHRRDTTADSVRELDLPLNP